jgi:hypothetical protein
VDDIERLLRRQDEADDDATRSPGSDDPGAVSFVGKTVAVGTYPTTAGRYFAVTPQDVTGAETEGGAGTVTGLSGTVLALHLGSTIPPAGTAVVVTRVDYRFVFAY